MSSPPQPIMAYLVKRESFYYPDSGDDVLDTLRQQTQDLLARDVAQLRIGAVWGSEEDTLELALRCYTGITVPKDQNGAITLLNNLNASEGTSRHSRARALALLSDIHYDLRIVEGADIDGDFDACWNIDSIYRAAACANEACALGFSPSGVVYIGMSIERLGLRRQEDCKFPGHSTERFAALSDLWEVVDQRKVKAARVILQKEIKLRKDRTAHICAAEGCGISATRKAALLRCSGKCVLEGKPAYCCKECQKKDWRRHRPFCREDAPIDDVSATKRREVLDLNDSDMTSGEEINLTDPKWRSRLEFYRLEPVGESGVGLDLPNSHEDPALSGAGSTESEVAQDFLERVLEGLRK